MPGFSETIGGVTISGDLAVEINTTGAKAYDADMQKFVVLMKDELEKAKEQILNVL